MLEKLFSVANTKTSQAKTNIFVWLALISHSSQPMVIPYSEFWPMANWSILGTISEYTSTPCSLIP